MNINCPVLESIKVLQTQHGLNYENYQRYRSYCSRRLHRLRKSLNVHQGVASSAKARHQRGRKLMDINNAMVLEAGEKNHEYAERMLLIPLCLAERAWSYAMQLKQETSDQPRKRYHLIRRLKKATEHAKRFEKLCHDPESPCTDRTKEEATAYAAYILGLYQVERASWSEAKENLSKSLLIYFKLSTSIRNDQVLANYRQRIEELRASLRYCAFNLGDQDIKKRPKFELPTTLQFHDLAFKHVQQLDKDVSMSKKAEPEKTVNMITSSPSDASNEVMGDDDDDEFVETREGVDDEEQEGEEEDDEEEEEDDDDDDDDDDKPSSRVGGVTGLVKNWLGGAWS